MNSYIVVFKSPKDHPVNTEEHIESFAAKVEASGGSITHRYNSNIMRGFAGTFSEDMRKELESQDNIKYIEPNAAVSTQ